MSAFTVYTTDANPQLLHSGEHATGDDERVDGWVDQLARVNNHPVDLFVDVPGARATCTIRASREGEASRRGRYLADYTADPGEPATAALAGLRDSLVALRDRGTGDRDGDSWEFSVDDPRWRVGFDAGVGPADCPGLDDADEDRLAATVADADGQLVLGMSSYHAALRTVRRLTERGVDATLAVNADGATDETAGVDLVLWPDADTDFAPMDERTREALAAAGFTPATEQAVLEDDPAADRAVVKDRHERPSALESFAGDGIGRIGIALTVLFSGGAVGAMAAIDPLHPLSGLSALGGIVGAVAGLFLGRSGMAAAAPATAAETDGGTVDVDAGGWGWQQYGAFLGFYLMFAYAFPSVFRLAGWPFGPVITPGATAVSVAVYVGALLVVNAVAYAVWRAKTDGSFEATDLVPIVAINALFGVGIVLTAGLACALWYDVIGFVGAC